MRIAWSLPVRGERLGSPRGDLVRAAALVGALRSLGHDVVVVEDSARAGAASVVQAYRRVARRILPRGVALALRDVGRYRHGIAHGRAVARAAKAHGAELIIETQVGFSPSGAVAARATALPLVMDDASPSSEEVHFGCALPGLAHRALTEVCASAARVAASSNAIASRLEAEGVAPAKLRVVPNGVDLAAYARVDRAAARVRLGLGDRLAVAYVGSYQRWHDVPMLVEAIAELAREDVVLVLAGDGPDRERARSLSTERGLGGRVMDLGPLPASRIPDLLAACDIGVLPGSNDYGHPMKLVEYAAAGLPAVAPDLAPVREATGGDGVSLFTPGDRAALGAAIAALLDSKAVRQRLGAEAREAARSASWASRASLLVDGLV